MYICIYPNFLISENDTHKIAKILYRTENIYY